MADFLICEMDVSAVQLRVKPYKGPTKMAATSVGT